MSYAAYRSRGLIFIARFGNWKWLYEDMPVDANWIRNDQGGKRLSKEDAYNAVDETATSQHFSSDELMHEFTQL